MSAPLKNATPAQATDLMRALLGALPSPRAKASLTTSETVDRVLRITDEHKVMDVINMIDRLVETKDVERVHHDGNVGKRCTYKLTSQGQGRRIAQGINTIYNLNRGANMAHTKKYTDKELGKMKLKDLIAHYNDITTGRKVDKLSSKAVAIRRIKGTYEEWAKKPARKGKGGKRGGPSRYQLIRDAFAKRKKFTRDELKKLTGWDDRNVHTAMSILKNEERMGPDNVLVTDYDRANKTYTRS
jgi:hypothetical protein